jgi:hypothetical protein
VDLEDPRLTKLKQDQLKDSEHLITEDCENIFKGPEAYYTRLQHSYKTICSQINQHRNDNLPEENINQIDYDLTKNLERKWIFESLPGIDLKPSEWTDNLETLTALTDQLRTLKSLEFFYEPVELLEKPR